MIFISILLFSISLIAWRQYSSDLATDDNEQPKILAMAHAIIELGIVIILRMKKI